MYIYILKLLKAKFDVKLSKIVGVNFKISFHIEFLRWETEVEVCLARFVSCPYMEQQLILVILYGYVHHGF